MESDEKIVDDTTFVENPVQDILSDSLKEHVNERLIFSRLLPCSEQSIPHTDSNNKNGISILTDNLILTSAANVFPSDIIDILKVTCIISAAPELPNIPLSSLYVAYHKVNILDSTNSDISLYFDEVADLINQTTLANGRTLIFCVAGVSRSASFCIAYLMKYYRLTLLEAYDYVKLRRPRIRPNCNFFRQLINYEKSLFGNSSVHMVYNESVQMFIPNVYDSEYKIIRNVNKKNHR